VHVAKSHPGLKLKILAKVYNGTEPRGERAKAEQQQPQQPSMRERRAKLESDGERESANSLCWNLCLLASILLPTPSHKGHTENGMPVCVCSRKCAGSGT